MHMVTYIHVYISAFIHIWIKIFIAESIVLNPDSIDIFTMVRKLAGL